MESDSESVASTPRSDGGGIPLVYHSDSMRSAVTNGGFINSRASSFAHNALMNVQSQRMSESFAVLDSDGASLMRVDRPDNSAIQEIVGLLKVKTSMLALGACERIKKTARVWPSEVIQSAILPELIHIIDEAPGSTLAGAAMSAMSTMALVPEGRQKICILGGAGPLVRLVARGEVQKGNTDKAVSLLMNLAADQQNRKRIREVGGVEALVALMRVAPLEPIMEHAMGALHNVMLTDGKSKTRAVEAGVAHVLARVLGARLDENHTLNVRVRMLISDLLRIPDMQERMEAAANEMGIKLPGMAGYVAPNRWMLGDRQVGSMSGSNLPNLPGNPSNDLSRQATQDNMKVSSSGSVHSVHGVMAAGKDMTAGPLQLPTQRSATSIAG